MDNVNHPSHYTKGEVECIEAIKASLGANGFCDYCKGNAIKYLWRWRDKGGVEDIRKAQVYIGWLLDTATEDEEDNAISHSFAELIDNYLCCTCAECGHSFATEDIPTVEFDIANRRAWVDIECPSCGKITDYQLNENTFRALESKKQNKI